MFSWKFWITGLPKKSILYGEAKNETTVYLSFFRMVVMRSASKRYPAHYEFHAALYY